MPINEYVKDRARLAIVRGLKTMLGQREFLARQLQEAQGQIEEAKRALLLVQRLEAQIPSQLQALAACPIRVDGRDGKPILIEEFRGRRALLRLQADLPAIRKHWQSRLRALGVDDPPPAKAA